MRGLQVGLAALFALSLLAGLSQATVTKEQAQTAVYAMLEMQLDATQAGVYAANKQEEADHETAPKGLHQNFHDKPQEFLTPCEEEVRDEYDDNGAMYVLEGNDYFLNGGDIYEVGDPLSDLAVDAFQGTGVYSSSGPNYQDAYDYANTAYDIFENARGCFDDAACSYQLACDEWQDGMDYIDEADADDHCKECGLPDEECGQVA